MQIQLHSSCNFADILRIFFLWRRRSSTRTSSTAKTYFYPSDSIPRQHLSSFINLFFHRQPPPLISSTNSSLDHVYRQPLPPSTTTPPSSTSTYITFYFAAYPILCKHSHIINFASINSTTNQPTSVRSYKLHLQLLLLHRDLI